MELLVLLAFNIIFCCCFYFFFKFKFNQETGSGKVKNELEELVILFNRKAEVNISTLEAKINYAKKIIDEIHKNKKNIFDKTINVVDKKIINRLPSTKIKLHNRYLEMEINDIISIDRNSEKKKKKQVFPKKNILLNTNDKLQINKRLESDLISGKNIKELAISYNMSIDELKLRKNLIKNKYNNYEY